MEAAVGIEEEEEEEEEVRRRRWRKRGGEETNTQTHTLRRPLLFGTLCTVASTPLTRRKT
jgi:hypothetical protein